MSFAETLATLRKALESPPKGFANDTVFIPRRDLVDLLRDWERLDTAYREAAKAGQVPEEVRTLLSRAQGQIEHLAECTENLGEDLEDDDVSEDVAEAREVAEKIGAYLAAAPAQGCE